MNKKQKRPPGDFPDGGCGVASAAARTVVSRPQNDFMGRYRLRASCPTRSIGL
jgi:hypothetical protein